MLEDQSESYSKQPPVVASGVLLPFILLVSCFALWGLANNMTDVLVAQFKKIYSLSDFHSGLVQMAFYGAYFCLALPAALYIRRFSYKSGVLLGLGVFALGALLFYPSSQTMMYGHFLASLFILAGGLAILETSANAYVFVLGSPHTATHRLNLAQSFNPVGSIVGVVIGKLFILEGLSPASDAVRASMPLDALRQLQAQELAAVMWPYLSVACFILVIWVLIALYPMPRLSGDQARSRLLRRGAIKRLWSDKTFVQGVFAQLLYVGCQIGCWSYTIRYVMVQLGGSEAEASGYLLLSIIFLSIGRFVCTALMKFLSPETLLGSLALLNSLLCAFVVFIGGKAGVYSLVLVSGCMSLMFPTIYGLSLKRVEADDIPLGGSFLIMSIIGGALLTAIMGRISDYAGMSSAFVVPMAAFTYLAYFGFVVCRRMNARGGN